MFGKKKKAAAPEGKADTYVLKKSRKKQRRSSLGVIILILVLIIACLGMMVGFLTDWLWFKDLGYARVFWTQLLTELKIGIPVFVLALLLVRVYLKSLKKGYFREIESHEIADERRLNLISWGLAFIFAIFSALTASRGLWLDFLKFVNATTFGLDDPLFKLDVSFYVFKLKFLTELNSMVLLLILGLVVITLLYYGILLSVRTPDVWKRQTDADEAETEPQDSAEAGADGNTMSFEELLKRRGARRARPKRSFNVNDGNFHKLMDIASGKLTILGVIFYLMLGIDFFLKQFDLLHAHTGTVYGAGFTDVNITLWVYRVIMLLSVAGAVLLIGQIKKSAFRKMLRVPIAMIVVGLLGNGIGLVVQNLVVAPDEINKESKYLENNIEFTRHAYGLDNIKVENYPANYSLTGEDIKNNQATFSNIRINDYEPVQDYYNQTQSIRQYYDFNDVDIDRYTLNGKETQTYLAPREINEKKISTTWMNKHIKYTHGYGVAVSQVDAVTASGQPDVLVKNIPPESSVDEIKITRPEIYFGELTNDYIIVNTDEQEFDYPDGNENKYTTYEGTGGIKLNPFNRLMFSLRERSLKLLVSSNVNSNSKIIINRNIISRISTIMPFLSYETDPYMTTVDGKLYWILDAYTTSAYYPYSEPYSTEIGTTNYIRNSIKVVVDAYNGDVDFYIVDEEDPIAQTYKKIYPTLFKDFEKMPEGIRAHIRYPNNLFKIQANVYTKYHMNDVKVFYQNEDLWDISKQIYGMEEKEMDPSYYIFKLPTEKEAEFINMIPFTPKSKQNMTALMMARNDGDNYGQMVVYKFPKNKTVYGPRQIEAQIDQSTEISKEFSLWDSAGSKYKRGDMFVIPVEDSLLYVEPVYLEASNQAIPEVKRVIVAYGDRIAYKPTLSEALEELFGEGYESNVPTEGEKPSGGGSQSSGGDAKPTQAELIQKANDAYDKAVEAQKNGDWAGYGKRLDELEGYLKQLKG